MGSLVLPCELLVCGVYAKSLQSFPTLCDPMDCMPTRLLGPWDSPEKNTGVCCHALLQGFFQTWGSNPSLLHVLHWQVAFLPLMSLGKPLVATGGI